MRSDAQGWYGISALPSGSCTLRASVTGKTPVEITGLALRDDHQTVQNLDLPVSALIRGTVLLPANPPEGYELYVSATQLDGPGWPVTVTGTSFALADIPAGTYDLTLMRYGYMPLKLRNLTVAAGQAMELGTLNMERSARVSGTIVPAPGTALSFLNSMVGLYDGQTLVTAGVANANGQFSIDIVPPGTYTVRVLNLGQGVSTEQEITLLPGGQAAGIVLNTLAGGVITGTVTNSALGQPVQGVPVDLVASDGQTRRTTTDDTGQYRFDSLPLGEYVVTLTSYGLSGSELVQIAATDGTAVVANLSYAPVATLCGVLQTAEGQPVGDGQVALMENGQVIATTPADATGAFQFALLRGGSFQVQASSQSVVFGTALRGGRQPGRPGDSEPDRWRRRACGDHPE